VSPSPCLDGHRRPASPPAQPRLDRRPFLGPGPDHLLRRLPRDHRALAGLLQRRVHPAQLHHEHDPPGQRRRPGAGERRPCDRDEPGLHLLLGEHARGAAMLREGSALTDPNPSGHTAGRHPRLGTSVRGSLDLSSSSSTSTRHLAPRRGSKRLHQLSKRWADSRELWALTGVQHLDEFVKSDADLWRKTSADKGLGKSTAYCFEQ